MVFLIINNMQYSLTENSVQTSNYILTSKMPLFDAFQFHEVTVLTCTELKGHCFCFSFWLRVLD